MTIFCSFLRNIVIEHLPCRIPLSTQESGVGMAEGAIQRCRAVILALKVLVSTGTDSPVKSNSGLGL